MKKYLALILLCFFTFSAFAENTQIEAATQQWAAALSSNDPAKIAALYESGALLYATFQNQLDTPKAITGYFAKLMKHQDLAVKFTKQHIRVFGGDTALNSGFYTFSYMEKGKEVTVPARYTFVFAHDNGKWLIVEHHSSTLPE